MVKQVSKVFGSFSTPTSYSMRVPGVPILPAFGGMVFVLTNPLGLNWYLSVVFICSSFIADDIEHFLLCLRIICTTSFTHFKTLFYFVLVLIYTDSLCVLIMTSFSDT